MEHNLQDIFLTENFLLNERRKSSNQSIWYHGTTSEFLREILKKGMVPNPKKKSWDKDENTSINSSTRISLEGSYWTTNLMNALISAHTTSEKFGGYSIVVCAQLNPKSSVQDEDTIRYHLSSILSDSIYSVLNINPHSLEYVYLEFLDGNRKKVLDYFISKAHKFLSLENEKVPIYKEELIEYFDAEFMRRLWYQIFDQKDYREIIRGYKRLLTYKENPDQSYEDSRDEIFEEIFDNNLDKHYWESLTLNALDHVGKKYRKMKSSFNPTLRMLEPVNFQGKNKIVSIIGFPFMGDREADITKQSTYLTILYGSTVLPDFIKKYHESETSKPLSFYDRNGKLIYTEEK